MLFHTRNSASAMERLEAAWTIPGELAGVLPNPSSPYGTILRTEGEILKGVTRTYLFHEFLEEDNQPTYVHEFLGRAARYGLEFLSEASTTGLLLGLPGPAQEAVSRWSDDVISREQYLDFVCNRAFRRTVLRRAGDPASAELTADAIDGLWVSAAVAPVVPDPDVTGNAAVEFTRPEKGGAVTTTSPLVKSALLSLYEGRPAAIDFDSLYAKVVSRLAEAGRPLPLGEEDGKRNLRVSILQLFVSDLVELHVRPPRPAAEVSARPVASPLARLQAANTTRVTSLRRRAVDLAEFDRAVLMQLDGSRDVEAILEALVKEVLSGDFDLSQEGQQIQDPEAIRALFAGEVEPALCRLAGDGLLAG
jgi:methyltransferase-like protein